MDIRSYLVEKIFNYTDHALKDDLASNRAYHMGMAMAYKDVLEKILDGKINA